MILQHLQSPGGQHILTHIEQLFLLNNRTSGILQRLQSPGEQQILTNIKQELFLLNNRASVILQRLQSPEGQQILTHIKQLSHLNNRTSVILQWISSFYGVYGNKEAEWLLKRGSKQEQSTHAMSYSRVKDIPREQMSTASTRWVEQYK